MAFLKAWIKLLDFITMKFESAGGNFKDHTLYFHRERALAKLKEDVRKGKKDMWKDIKGRYKQHQQQKSEAKKTLDPKLLESILDCAKAWNQSEELSGWIKEVEDIYKKIMINKEQVKVKEYEHTVSLVHGLVTSDNALRAGVVGQIRNEDYWNKTYLYKEDEDTEEVAGKKKENVEGDQVEEGEKHEESEEGETMEEREEGDVEKDEKRITGAYITLTSDGERTLKTGHDQIVFLPVGDLELCEKYLDIKEAFFSTNPVINTAFIQHKS